MIQVVIAAVFSILMALLALTGLYCTFFSDFRQHKKLSLFIGSMIVAALAVIFAWLGGV